MSSLRDNLGKTIPNISVNIPIQQLLTLYGVEFEFDWVEEAVPDTNGLVYVRWQTSPNKYTILNTRQLQSDKERGFYRAYTQFAGGAQTEIIPPRNLRADSTVVSESIVEKYSAPTTINPSSEVIQVPLFGSPGGGPVSATGDINSDFAFRIYAPGTDFILEFENNSDDISYFKGLFKWFEVTAEALPIVKEF